MILLSHILSSTTPTYRSSNLVEIGRQQRPDGKPTPSSSRLCFNSHTGTHVDAPSHFESSGWSLADFPNHFWASRRPYLIDCPTDPHQLVSLEQFVEQPSRVPNDCDFLMIRTGAEEIRKTDPAHYAISSPGISPRLALHLRENYPLKFLGIDSISISCPSRSEEGRRAHVALLGTRSDGRPPVLPVEDMALFELRKQPSRVLVAPLIFENADGSPCTVLAEF